MIFTRATITSIKSQGGRWMEQLVSQSRSSALTAEGCFWAWTILSTARLLICIKLSRNLSMNLLTGNRLWLVPAALDHRRWMSFILPVSSSIATPACTSLTVVIIGCSCSSQASRMEQLLQAAGHLALLAFRIPWMLFSMVMAICS